MSRPRIALLIVLLAALGVRVAYLAADPHPYAAWEVEGSMARNIVDHGKWFVFDKATNQYVAQLHLREHRLIEPGGVNYAALDRPAKWEPEIGESVGPAAILAGLWQITGGESYWPLQLLQAIVDALTVLLVYQVAMRLFKRKRAALLAAGLYAVYPPLAWQTTIPYVDIWAVDFTIAIVAAYLESLHSARRIRWLIVCGILLGFGSYFRPNLLILPTVLALVSIRRLGWRGALGQCVLVTAIGLLFLVPWTIRNFNDFHVFIPARGGLGETLWAGLGEIPNNFGAVWTDGGRTTEAEMRRAYPSLRVESPAWDAVLRRWAIRAIERHPLFYARILVKRTALSTVWDYEAAWMHRGTRSPVGYRGGPLAFAINRPFDLLQDGLQPAVFLFAMLSMGLTWRSRRQEHVLLIAIVLSVLVPYILIHVEPRFLLPAVFAYMIWIGLGLDLLADRVRGWVQVRREREVSVTVTA